jgi:hypothetical protein
MQSAALADMALLNLRMIIVWHLLWACWAFSFTWVKVQPLPGLAYVVDYVLQPALYYIIDSESLDLFLVRAKQVRWHPACASNALLLWRTGTSSAAAAWCGPMAANRQLSVSPTH